MRFKEYIKNIPIKEAIIDTPRQTYATGVFDNADTNNPKLKPAIIDMVKKQVEEFEKEYPVLKIGLIGSILTKRYRDDADLDFNVLFDIPKEKQEEERLRLSHQFLSASNPNAIQGKLIPGTRHPINYFFISTNEVYDDQQKKADAAFDPIKNKFIKRPEDFEFDPSLYVKDFDIKVHEIDVIKGELKRDIIDYKQLKSLTINDVLNLQDKIKDKLDEIEYDIELIIKVGDKVDAERRKAFDTDMSPDEIRQYGIKNRLPKAVIYKMLEKYHYITFYKKCKKILEDGIVTDKEIDSIKTEAVRRRRTIAFTFGRFNPPTSGHAKLIAKVSSVRANSFKIFLSRSWDTKKNPLSPREKLAHMKKMFPRFARNIEINTTNMILDIASKLYRQGYTEIFMVVGSDRVREFETILNKYNDVKSRHGHYNFDNINVLSAGERDPDSEGVSGMSASKMRTAAQNKDLTSFKSGLPAGYRDAEKLFKDVRKGMRLAAEYEYAGDYRPIKTLQEFEQNQIRDLYIREMIFNIGDKVNNIKENINGKVIRKGTNYIVLEDNNNNLHKAWIWDCLPISADREAQVREYNLDIDYGFEAVSEKREEEPDKVKESYEIGHDYAQHTVKVTPGQDGYDPNYEGGSYKPAVDGTSGPKVVERPISTDISVKDINDWSTSSETIDKYKERYKEEWQKKLSEVVSKMIRNL